MIFINNKYTSVYFQIIARAQSRTLPEDVYRERHHILPKCMGGSNKSINLVSLTAKEHVVCHRLLPNMVSNSEIKSKLKFASWAMTTQKPLSNKIGDRRKCTSRYYAKLREHVANENRIRQTGVSPGNKGVKQSEERKQKTRNVKNCECPHCHKSFKPWIISRFHGDKCKSLTDFCGPKPKPPKKANNVKQFKATSPESEITISANLKEFCHRNNLSFAQCRRTAVGVYTEYKGWKFEYL